MTFARLECGTDETCEPRPAVGEPCTSDGYCESGDYCSACRVVGDCDATATCRAICELDAPASDLPH